MFDPVGILATLERHRVSFVIVGAFARVIHGTGEVTRSIDIVPSMKPENLRRLEAALQDLNARRTDGKTLEMEEAAADERVIALETDRGALAIVRQPEGTRGYDDLRRAAAREPLGSGVRPSVASVGDLTRMLGALDRAQDQAPLRLLRRLAELERQLVIEL
jgi:hypothetical protein